MSPKSLLIAVVLVPLVGLAQTVTPTPDFSPPPMVPAAPPPMPAPEPSTQPGTPPPPGPTYVPGQQGKPGYTYSPYGKPKVPEKPGPEVGLMVTEALFGSLTAAGVTVLPYFLLFGSGGNGLLSDPTLSSIIFCAIFGAAPLAVAQTQVSLANGSRFYQAELWVPALVGIAGQAGVLGIFYATGWLPTGQASGGVPNGGSVAWLMIGAIGIVPLLQMAAINLFKHPKDPVPVYSAADRAKPVLVARPSLAPLINPSSGALSGGAAVLSGSF